MPRPPKTAPLPELPQGWDEDMLSAYMMEGNRIPASKQPKPPAPWLPSLSPKQMEVFMDETDNTLVVGTRLTGKGVSCGYNVVKHAYDHYRALVLVIVKTKRQGNSGGFFAKLGADILPDFEKNLEGFEFKGPYMSIDKDQIFSVRNRWGGMSVIQMMSIQHDQDVIRKVKGIEATKVYVDEGQLFTNKVVYKHLRGTLKRSKHVPSKSQTFLVSANPDSPKHWLAETFKVLTPQERKPNYRVIEVMAEDNPDQTLVREYHASLVDSYGADSVEVMRDVHGKWVDIPEGDALFKDHFMPSVHVIGIASEGTGFSPLPGLTLIVGADPGEVNHGFTISQEVPTKDRVVWCVFDEIEFVKSQTSFETLTLKLMDRLNHWCEMADYNFSYTCVSDNSAFNRFRSTTGSFDYLEIEKHFKANLHRFPRLNYPLRILEAPKGDGSVATRCRLLRDMMERSEFYVSAGCPKTIEMLTNITGTKKTPMAPDTHDPRKHLYDALGYPIIYNRAGGIVETEQAREKLKPEIYAMGR